MKSKGRPRKCWLSRVISLKKKLILHDKVLEIKLIKETLDKNECKEFETALQHKSKLCLQGIEVWGWVWGIFETCKGTLFWLLLSFVQVPINFLRSWVGMLKGVGLRNVIIVGLIRILLTMFYLGVKIP